MRLSEPPTFSEGGSYLFLELLHLLGEDIPDLLLGRLSLSHVLRKHVQLVHHRQINQWLLHL